MLVDSCWAQVKKVGDLQYMREGTEHTVILHPIKCYKHYRSDQNQAVMFSTYVLDVDGRHILVHEYTVM